MVGSDLQDRYFSPGARYVVIGVDVVVGIFCVWDVILARVDVPDSVKCGCSWTVAPQDSAIAYCRRGLSQRLSTDHEIHSELRRTP